MGGCHQMMSKRNSEIRTELMGNIPFLRCKKDIIPGNMVERMEELEVELELTVGEV